MLFWSDLWMMPILLPAERILHDVPPESQKGVVASDDLVKESRLPGEISSSTVPDPLGAGPLEMSDGLS